MPLRLTQQSMIRYLSHSELIHTCVVKYCVILVGSVVVSVRTNSCMYSIFRSLRRSRVPFILGSPFTDIRCPHRRPSFISCRLSSVASLVINMKPLGLWFDTDRQTTFTRGCSLVTLLVNERINKATPLFWFV